MAFLGLISFTLSGALIADKLSDGDKYLRLMGGLMGLMLFILLGFAISPVLIRRNPDTRTWPLLLNSAPLRRNSSATDASTDASSTA